MIRRNVVLVLFWGVFMAFGGAAGILFFLMGMFGIMNRAEEYGVEEVTKAGGSVRREGDGPRAPVVAVTIPDGKATDDLVRRLLAMKELREVSLSGTGVTDASLTMLEHVPKLNRLVLRGTKVTAEGLATFRETKPDCAVEEIP